MAWLKKDSTLTRQQQHQWLQRDPNACDIRIIATGTIFLTQTLNIQAFPQQGSVIRAQTVTRERGGAAANALSVLTQFEGTEAWIMAPIGGGIEGAMLVKELEDSGISTRLCCRRDGIGVPISYVINSDSSDSRTVINYNPIPDITHDEFIRLLSPLLFPSTPPPSTPPSEPPEPMRPPFDWIHFEGRTAQTTLSNMTGIDGLARERDWRHKIVISLEVGRPNRQGQEALIPYADVIFFSKAYALAQSFTSARAFLLSLIPRAPPHALLIVSWGTEGAALLSIPTREYLQASSFVPDVVPKIPPGSVRSSGTSFGGLESIESPSDRRNSWDMYPDDSESRAADPRMLRIQRSETTVRTEMSADAPDDEIVDEAGAEDAFIGAMIFALSRRVLPGAPYTPRFTDAPSDFDKGRWRLDECLRFATELTGRKIRRKGFEGLAKAMEKVGWFNTT
ncbi:hypothetical protein BOTBODRAFT_605486 [Botryobasidium botryosum FD-172 SS1]|uniref:Carbohydrate kinase PfkB domain-containing protein n=1 Tax=Botryobasidium botryosum (strain FD-172 SS1) TaxID=930990 RepID=A0A067MNR8_BOTB1|nr:hypothetical protein BOTBODRAFT_605486 [Botryobasidium botryosum FD-172 SS1]